ncbi:uncharacterized protein TRIADDRAFT_61890 [Trichoplax adhaerens]|uniref:B30.2/SPRY domain-containing protein n=1 Tax=Trichoplax adhaerens TaxID=10228 RepID=B3SC93_TRIAD|nr:hypothetical protein TRIADDRAFT_61890 [Trichoplax adhaerens]EDV19621.1 hypothetical protein TRIADDRAFT_61890 [Trichoplax adhaerens]|eukprot:XP_002117859.1 hypothetical protein TRIADDRAFT_61890 [Trichoplax adhaerens]
MDEQQARKLKVVELRTEISKRGIVPKGNKAALLQTLLNALKEESENSPQQEEQAIESPVQDTSDNEKEVVQVQSSSIEEEMDVSQQDTTIDDTLDARPSPSKRQMAKKSARNRQANDAANADDNQPSTPIQNISVVEEDQSTDAIQATIDQRDIEESDSNNAQQVEATSQATSEKESDKGVEEATNEMAAVVDSKPMVEESTGDNEVNKMEQPEQSMTTAVGGRKRKADEALDNADDSKTGQDQDEGNSAAADDDMPASTVEADSKSTSRQSEEPSDFWSEEFDESAFVLDRYNSDLHVKISKDGLITEDYYKGGFAYLWGGIRATYGAKSGKVFYEIKILQFSSVELPDPETHKNALRVGWSVDSPYFQLGEDKYSYGFGSSGKAATTSNFFSYGKEFGVGDVIGCYLDLESEPSTVGFMKNGEDLGSAFQLAVDLSGKALFPHIYLKNARVQVNFGNEGEIWYNPPDGYSYIGGLRPDQLERAVTGPTKDDDCEVLMMIGLPGAGKTTWAEKHSKDNPDKRFYVLGTNLIMERMRVTGLQRKYNYQGRFQELISLSTECLGKLFEVAGRMKRNYILDQTNVYASAQKNKMRWFAGFRKKAIIVVPRHDELQKRSSIQKEKENKDIPSETIREMKFNFTLPIVGDIFEAVEYVEEREEIAKKIVIDYHREASSSGSSRKHPRTDSYNRYYPDRQRKDRHGHSNQSHRNSHQDRRNMGNSSQRRWIPGQDQRRGMPPRSRPSGGMRGHSHRGSGYQDRPRDRNDYNYRSSQYSSGRDSSYRHPGVPQQSHSMHSGGSYYSGGQNRGTPNYYSQNSSYPSSYDQSKSYQQSYGSSQGYSGSSSSSQYPQSYSQSSYSGNPSRHYDSNYASQSSYDQYNRSGFSGHSSSNRSSQGYNSTSSDSYYRRS